MLVNRLMKARIPCTVYVTPFEDGKSDECILIVLFLWGIGKLRETWEGALKGLIERADMTSSQHRCFCSDPGPHLSGLTSFFLVQVQESSCANQWAVNLGKKRLLLLARKAISGN